MNKESEIVYLIGPRASGKTSVGRALAEQLNYQFIDTDHQFEKHWGQTIAQVVEQEGWESFRQKESEILRICSKPKSVIATGGGMVLAESNRHHMKQNGRVFYLSASIQALSERLLKDPNHTQRPSLTGASIADEIKEVIETRLPLYLDTAHHQINAEAELSEIVSSIHHRLKNGNRHE